MMWAILVFGALVHLLLFCAAEINDSQDGHDACDPVADDEVQR